MNSSITELSSSAKLDNFNGSNLHSHLSIETIKDIKMMLLYSGLSVSDIARYKGLSQSQVSHIKNGDRYSNIDID